MMRQAIVLAAIWTALALHAGRPVAKWDVVPYQCVGGAFPVGVVAFHEKGVTVEFTVNGEKAASASAPSLNPRTKVWEYVFDLDARKYPDGELRLGATASAPGEEPYALPELVLYANSKKTMGSRKAVWVDPVNGNEFADGTKSAPVKTIHRGIQLAGDGGAVLLQPGVYQAKLAGGGLNRRFWTVLTPAPGISREQVKILGGRPGTEKLRFRNVELYCDCADGYGTIVMGEGGATSAWFDNCRFTNRQGRYGGSTTPFGNRLHAYVTGGCTEEMGNGPCCEFVRDHQVRSIASDAFSCNDSLVVNCSVSGIDPGGTTADPDVFSGFSTGTNWTHDVILYNVKATDVKGKGIAGQRLRDSAFVNVLVENTAGNLVYTRFSEAMENVLFAHVTLVDQKWQWMQTKNGRGDFKPKDVSLVNCVLREMEGFGTGDGSEGLSVKSCAFYNRDFYGKTAVFGEDAVVIEREFADPSGGDFALPATSNASTAGVTLACVPADINGEPYPADGRPCGAFAK